MQNSSQSIFGRVTSFWNAAKATPSQSVEPESDQLNGDDDVVAQDNSMMDIASDQLASTSPIDEEKARRRARKREKKLRRLEQERLQALQEEDPDTGQMKSSSQPDDVQPRKKKHKKNKLRRTSADELPASEILATTQDSTLGNADLENHEARENGNSEPKARRERREQQIDYAIGIRDDQDAQEGHLPPLPEQNGLELGQEEGSTLEDKASRSIRTPSPAHLETTNESVELPHRVSPSKKEKKRRISNASESASPKKRRVDKNSSPQSKGKRRTSSGTSQRPQLEGIREERLNRTTRSIYSLEPTPEPEEETDAIQNRSHDTLHPNPSEGSGSVNQTPNGRSNSRIPKTPKATPARKASNMSSDRATPSGKFSEGELDRIASAVEAYREANRMTQAAVNDIIQADTRRGKNAHPLWLAIFEELPGRDRQSVLKVCRRKFHNYAARGVWTEEDEDELRTLFASRGNKWKEIGQIMNRHPEDVRDRWRNYTVCGDKLKKDFWTEKEEDNLRQAVSDQIDLIRIQRAAKRAANEESENDADKADDEFVDWQVISEMLDHTRSRLQCITKWKTLKNREDSDDDAQRLKINQHGWRLGSAESAYMKMRRGDEYALLCAIRDSHAGSEAKIPWRKLANSEFQQQWTTMTRKLAWTRMRDRVPHHEDMKLQEIVSHLAEEMENKYGDKLQDFFMAPSSQKKKDRQQRDKSNKKQVASETRKSPGKKILSQAIIGEEDDLETLQTHESTPKSKAGLTSPKTPTSTKSRKHQHTESVGSAASSSNFEDMDDIPAKRPTSTKI